MTHRRLYNLPSLSLLSGDAGVQLEGLVAEGDAEGQFEHFAGSSLVDGLQFGSLLVEGGADAAAMDLADHLDLV